MMSLLMVDYLIGGLGVDGITTTFLSSPESQFVFLLVYFLVILPQELGDTSYSGATFLLVQLLDIVPP